MKNKMTLLGILVSSLALIHCGDSTNTSASHQGEQISTDDSTIITTPLGTLSLECFVQGTQRSKISVDASNISHGKYYAVVESGPNEATSPIQESVGDEVEFDFDSDHDDIAAGATPIPANFAQSGTVDAKVYDDTDHLILEGSVNCIQK